MRPVRVCRPWVLILTAAAMLAASGPSLAQEPPQGDSPEIQAKVAEVALLKARIKRLEAEVALGRYLERRFPQELAALRDGEAKAHLEVMKARQQADPMAVQKAKFGLEGAMAKVAILEKVTKPKKQKELQAAVDAAKAEEAAAQAKLEKGR